MGASPHKMVIFERMSDYRGVGSERFHCICVRLLYSMLSVCLSVELAHSVYVGTEEDKNLVFE